MAEMARHLGAQLCEVWGLDPNKVKRIVISLDASALVFAEVTIVTDGEISEMLLKLRPVEPAQDENCGDFWCEICPTLIDGSLSRGEGLSQGSPSSGQGQHSDGRSAEEKMEP